MKIIHTLSIAAVTSVIAAAFAFNANAAQANDSAQNNKVAIIDHSQLNVEELRLDKASKAFPRVFSRHQKRVGIFETQIHQARNFTTLTQLILRHGKAIWQEAVVAFDQDNNFDDRPLYWARLQMSAALKSSAAFQRLLDMQQAELLWKFELLTRGQADIKFDKNADKKILLTGFDPFFLDKNIKQSNPSGITALALDDFYISVDGQSVEIETLMIPVRFKDFDQGMIETLLTPYMKNTPVDMVVTVSMGRKDFDLERFPALRRSANAPDNLNVYTGATATNPLVPMLGEQALKGDEFVEFSLPVQTMQSAQGAFKINDNHQVSTLTRQKFNASSLAQLQGQTSVEGSGGGYLSNEISYRSILLRNHYQPIMPVGHIHTPRIKGFDAATSAKIVKQIKNMLAKASTSLH
ncbi:hypothetical protein [Thalassotalea sp. PLHSN55]|uniref:hypothetical protein n=1 Tax=Thalassotalea sp. PLHSN55 TaxID=3435888 RepID=UPI003F8424A4